MQTDQTKRDSLRASLANKPLGELFWILYKHQGGSSPEGQPIRELLGMGQFDRMTGFQIEMGKRWAKQAQVAQNEAPKREPLVLENAPIGTRAPAIGGGAWIKNDRGWRWGDNGSTFDRPGGDWTGGLVEPELLPNAGKRSVMRENEGSVDLETAIQWAKDAGGQVMVSHHITVPDCIEITPRKLEVLVNRAVDHGRQQADTSELVDALKRSRVEIMAFAKSCGFGLMTESVIQKIDTALSKHGVKNDH